MLSELSVPMADELNVNAENVAGRSTSNKKNRGKIPKKIHKAEREKLKRDNLNELFLNLGHALEPARQNNGKASILADATHLLRDLIAQVECLKKENAALLTESHYVTGEKNELKDENIVLGAEITKLQNEVQERSRSGPVWSNAVGSVHLQHANRESSSPEGQFSMPLVEPTSKAPPVVGPVIVIPLQPEIQPYQKHNASVEVSMKPPSQVSRPHARYPTSSDSWPSQILTPRAADEATRPSSRSTSNDEAGSGAMQVPSQC